MGKFEVKMRDIQRYRVITDVLEKRLTTRDASEILGLSRRHIFRLKTKVKKDGFRALLRKKPDSPPHKRINEELLQEILRLRRKIYYDFNLMHFKEKLEEIQKINLCYESLRKILISEGEHQPRKKIVHRERRRMPKAGMLVQMDSSYHQWIQSVSEKWWLVAMIDDATNEVPCAQFFPSDTVFSNMHVMRRFIKEKGLFMSLYADKASHFKTTRHGGTHSYSCSFPSS